MSNGWKLVPVEPTEEMNHAARDWSVKKYGMGIGRDGSEGCYAAMLAAAPQPPSVGGVETAAWLVRGGGCKPAVFIQDPTGWAHGYQVDELVCRQHLTARDQRIVDQEEELEWQHARIQQLEAALNTIRNHTSVSLNQICMVDAALAAKQVNKDE